MISQILPHLLPAAAMTRVSLTGTYSKLDHRALEAVKQEPLVHIAPEAINILLSEDVSFRAALSMLGFACLRHKALLEIIRIGYGHDSTSATVWILDAQESHNALFVVRKKSVFFILPTRGFSTRA